MTKDFQARIARVAIDRMRYECETGFEFLSRFHGVGVRRFLNWVRNINSGQRMEAALGVTCRQLKLCHIACENTPQFERWADLYSSIPLYTGLDRTWIPKRRSKAAKACITSSLTPVEWRGRQSLELSENNPLSHPSIRTAIEISTALGDIVILQFLRGDTSLKDLSYVGLLGLGQTCWQFHSDEECAAACSDLPRVIEKAKELV